MTFVTDLLSSLGLNDATYGADYSGAAVDKIMDPTAHVNDDTPTDMPHESGNSGWSIADLLKAIGGVGGAPFGAGSSLGPTDASEVLPPHEEPSLESETAADSQVGDAHKTNLLAAASRNSSRADADLAERMSMLKSASSPDSAVYVAKGNDILGDNSGGPKQSKAYDSTSDSTQSYTPAGAGTFTHSQRPIPEQLAIAELAQQKVDPAIAGMLIDNGGLNGARQALLSLAQQQAEPMSQKIMKVLGVAASMKNPGAQQTFTIGMLRQLGMPDADIAHLISTLPKSTPSAT